LNSPVTRERYSTRLLDRFMSIEEAHPMNGQNSM
jgi:hypothetical protein